MEKKTYLQESVKGGKLIRWISMPLKVFIAPMNFYSKHLDSKLNLPEQKFINPTYI